MTHTAETWPSACAMLAFGNKDSQGGPIHDATAEEWAKHLREARRLGFTEVDPTDTWVRVADLEAARLAELKDVLADVGLTIPAISTSRRSVLDAEHGEEYLAYSHRLLDVAAELGVKISSSEGTRYITSSISSSRMIFSPRAPTFRAIASSATASRASSVKRSATFSKSSKVWYCLMREFFGSLRIDTRDARSRSCSVATTGTRPTNSGIIPNLIMSSGWPFSRSSPARRSFFEASFAPNPIAFSERRRPMISSRPTNAPPQMKRMFVVSIWMNSWCGCLRPP